MSGRVTAVALAAVVVFCPLLAHADQGQDYVIGVDDVLNVSVWQRQDLNRTVVVRSNGKITFPPVGDVQAAGLTTSALAQSIEDELYSYMRESPQVTVAVAAFNSQKVFVTGQVAQPGRYAFERIPGLVEVLAAAGGVLPGAQLSEIRVIRGTGTKPETMVADLSKYYETGETGDLPPVQPGDMIYVPGSFVGAGGQAGGQVAGGGGNVAYVFGQVARPGAYALGSQADIVEVLSLAGGTGPLADLRHVQVVANEAGGRVVAEIDLESYLAQGSGAGFPVRPGDTINVPLKSPNAGAKAWAATTQAFALSRDLLNVVFIADYFKTH
jgi:polysaccharide export outer membrane protein